MHTELKAVVIGIEYVWAPNNVPEGVPSLVLAAARKGFQEWLQDAASTATATEDEQKANPDLLLAGSKNKAERKRYTAAMLPVRKAAMDKRFAKIKDGTYTQGGGGGGRTQIDTRLQAWKVYLGMEKKPNKEVQPAMLSFVMAQLVNNGVAKASDPGLTDLTEKYFDTVVKQVESDDPKWKEFHKAARLAAGELDDELPSFKLDLGKLQDAA